MSPERLLTDTQPSHVLQKARKKETSEHRRQYMRQYHQQYRAQLSPSKRCKLSQQSYERVKRSREKKKKMQLEKGSLPPIDLRDERRETSKSNIILTLKRLPDGTFTCRLNEFQIVEEKRQYHRDYYKIRIAREHWKKKQARLRRRRENYADNKKSKSSSASQPPTPSSLSYPESPSTHLPGPSGDTRTPAARRKAVQRAKQGFPHSPSKFDGTLLDLCRQRNLLQVNKEAEEVGCQFIEQINSLKNKKDKHSITKRRTLLSCLKRKQLTPAKYRLLGMDRRTAMKYMTGIQPVRKEKVEKEVARNFFHQEATPLPDRKLVSKKTGLPCLQLQVSIFSFCLCPTL